MVQKSTHQGGGNNKQHSKAIAIIAACTSAVFCAVLYFALFPAINVSFCADIATQRTPAFLWAGFFVFSVLTIYIFRDVYNAVLSALAGVLVIASIISLLMLWCSLTHFASDQAQQKTVVATADHESGIEVSASKVRSVVAENIANLKELEGLRAQQAASGGVNTETIIIQQNAPISVTGSIGGGVECGSDQIMIYDSGWACADFENLLEDADITPEGEITEITNAGVGNTIATYENEDGVLYDINESITTLTDNGDGTFSYSNEQGTVMTISAASLETLTAIAVGADGHTISYLDEDGVITTIDIHNLETTTTITDNIDGTLTYTNEDGVAVTIDTKDLVFDPATAIYADGKVQCLTGSHIVQWDDVQLHWSCVDITDIETATTITDLIIGNTIGTFVNEDGIGFDIDETITTIVDNGDGTFTFTAEGGAQTTISGASLETLTLMTNLIAGNRIATFTDENGNSFDIDETVTILTDNGDGSFTYTNEVGVPVTFTESLTKLVSAIAGNKIGTFTDEDGNAFDINETITTIADNGNGTFTFAAEGGAQTIVNVANLETTTTLVDNVDGTFTHTNEDATVVIVDHKDVIYNAANTVYADGKLQCLADNHILQWDGVGLQWECVSLDSIDGSVTVTDNADGTFTVSVADPGGTITTTIVDHKDMVVDGVSALYTDGKISCAADDEILQWDGAVNQWICEDLSNLETTTTITDNADGTFTYINEDGGVGVTVDHKDFDFDTATVVYADGKLQCVTDGDILLWDGVATEWDCASLDSIDGSVTVADNTDGTFTITVVNPGGVTTATTVDHKDMVVDGTTALYTDGKISCASDKLILQWDGTASAWSCIDVATIETTTTLNDNADGTFTYVNEDGGVGITVDHKDFAYNATTTVYADGKIQCVADNHILQWDGVNAWWDCADLDSIDGSVTVTDNTDGTFTVAVLDAGGTTTTTTVDHKDFEHDASVTYVDGKIACGVRGEILAFNGTNWSCLVGDKLITHSKVTDNTDGTLTHTSGDGVVTTIDAKDFVFDAASVSYADGKVECIAASETLLWNGTQWICVDPLDDFNVVTTLTDNANGTITYTSEDATVTTFDHKDFVFDATTMTYADGKVACLTDDHVMVWDTPGNQWMCQDPDGFETVTTLTDNTDGTFTYTSENSTVTSVDHTDFTFDASTVAYTDGKVSCLTDGHILTWDDTSAEWGCVANEADEICDGDDDTCVYVDEGDADADDIRFVLDGAEHFRMTGSTLTADRRATFEVLNSGESVFIGEQAGWVDNYTSNKNTFVGFNAGLTSTTGDENVFLGHQSGDANTTGRDNVFVGKNTGTTNTTGYLNTFLGHAAGVSNTTGFQNTFVGFQTGESNTTGRYNTFIGQQSGESTTTGQYNTLLGFQAGQLNTAGIGNVFMGREAGSNGLGGIYNIGIGYRASDDVTTGGNYNTSLGYQAGEGLTIQDFNNFLGYRAGRVVSGDTNNAVYIGTRSGEDSSGGTGNTAIGYESAEGITGGTYNTYLGFRSGEVADGGNQNSFIGSHAGRNAQSGTYNTAIGYYAGDNIANGIGNSIFGYTAGRNLTGGNYNSFIGYQAGHNASGGTHNQALGYRAGRDISAGTGNLLLGYDAGLTLTGGNYSSYIGRSAGSNVSGGTDNVGIGLVAAQDLTQGTQNAFVGAYSGTGFAGGNYNAGFGRYTFSRSTGGNYNVAIGEQAGRDVSGGTYNFMGGYQAGHNVAGGSHNVMLGYRSGRDLQAGTYNNIIGRDAGLSIVNASHNDIYGAFAGQNLDGGNYNVLSGYTAGRFLTAGDDNVFIGRQAGLDATTATQSVAIGHNAGQSLISGLRNVAIGQNALGLQTIGNENIGIGYQAGYRNTDGNSNVFIGRQAGRGSNVNGSNNVFIGNRAGYSEAGSNKLYIEGGGAQYTQNNSLIYGEFDNDILRFNADVGIGTGTPAERLHVIGNILATGTITPSDRRFKKDIQQVDSALEQLLKIRGTTYDYKDNELIGTDYVNKHQYGVIAQEVEEVFPNLVEEYDFDGDGSKDYKAVNYTGLTPVMIEAIRDLSKESETTLSLITELDGSLVEQFERQKNEIDQIAVSQEESAENSIVDGIQAFVQKIVAKAHATFEKTVAFLGRVTFYDRVTFADPDMAGYTLINEGDKSVYVGFERSFAQRPVVTATAHDHTTPYSVDNLDVKGFEIVIDERAEKDHVFAWIAIPTTEDTAVILQKEDDKKADVKKEVEKEDEDQNTTEIDEEGIDEEDGKNKEISIQKSVEADKQVTEDTGVKPLLQKELLEQSISREDDDVESEERSSEEVKNESEEFVESADALDGDDEQEEGVNDVEALVHEILAEDIDASSEYDGDAESDDVVVDDESKDEQSLNANDIEGDIVIDENEEVAENAVSDAETNNEEDDLITENEVDAGEVEEITNDATDQKDK